MLPFLSPSLKLSFLSIEFYFIINTLLFLEIICIKKILYFFFFFSYSFSVLFLFKFSLTVLFTKMVSKCLINENEL